MEEKDRDYKKDKDPSQIVRNDIVKGIFSRPTPDREEVSTIFTHFRHSPKVLSPGYEKKTQTGPLKLLPAAIDIGAYSVKLLQLSLAEKGEPEVACIDEEGITPATAQDPANAIKTALKKVVNRNRLGHSCATTLPAREVQFYNMVFPPMPEDELAQAIRYKITQLKPLDSDTEDIIIRFSKWDGAGDISKGSQQKLLVACANRNAVSARVSLLDEAGLKTVKVGVAPFDLINLSRFYKTGDPRDQVTLWVDLGAENTFLAIEKGGSLCFSRRLTLTSGYMTKMLAQYRGTSNEEAERLKRNYGLSYWSADKNISPFYESAGAGGTKKDEAEITYHGLISHLENLVIDIMHSFKYFSYQVTQSQISRFDRVILCGGGANLKNLDQFLSVRLGAPVERINPFSMFKLSDVIQARRRDLIGASSNFALCGGLAFGQRITEPKQINFLREEEKSPIRILADVRKRWPLVAAAAVVAFVISLTGIQMARAGYYKKRMNTLTKKVSSTKAQLGNMQAVELKLNKEEAALLNEKTLLEARRNLIRVGLRDPDDFSARLTSIAALLPDNAWITRLRYKEGKLIITGSTNDISVIARLIEDIKSSEDFIDADFNYTKRDPEREVYDFEVVADVKI